MGDGYEIEEYTRAIVRGDDGTKTIIYAHPFLLGKKWYDWVYVHFQESDVSGNDVENYYPSKILGFVTIDGVTEAVIHCSMTPLSWADVE